MSRKLLLAARRAQLAFMRGRSVRPAVLSAAWRYVGNQVWQLDVCAAGMPIYVDGQRVGTWQEKWHHLVD